MGRQIFYELSFSNRGGLVMPIIIEWTFKDGTTEIQRIPVQIWRKNEQAVTKAFIKDKEVQAIRLDPMRETADINENNNIWPLRQMPSRFELFKSKATVRSGGNAMQKEIALYDTKQFTYLTNINLYKKQEINSSFIYILFVVVFFALTTFSTGTVVVVTGVVF